MRFKRQPGADHVGPLCVLIRTSCFFPFGGVTLEKPHQENESDLCFERITVSYLSPSFIEYRNEHKQ